MREERTLRVFEHRVLRRIFGPKRDEVTGEWRKLHNEELNELYCSPNIVRVIKWRRMRWAGNVACMGEWRGLYRVWWEDPSQPLHGSAAVSVHCTKSCIYSQKVLLRMGEFVARNM